ncbi:semaphorin-3F [Tachysurus ichikawai]
MLSDRFRSVRILLVLAVLLVPSSANDTVSAPRVYLSFKDGFNTPLSAHGAAGFCSEAVPADSVSSCRIYSALLSLPLIDTHQSFCSLKLRSEIGSH